MDEETVIIPCKKCGTRTLTKIKDSFGNPIKEVLCWNCISNIIEEKNSSKYLRLAKEKDKEALRRIGKEKPNYKGLMDSVYARLAKKFTTQDVFESWLKSKRDLGEAVINDKKTKNKIVYNYVKFWMKHGKITKHGKGRSSYYSKI